MSPARARSPFHLLLVEDEPADAALFIELIQEADPEIHVHHVPNGREALAFVTREGRYAEAPSPQLIVLDLNMPIMDGHTFLKLAKNHSRARAIPVLILSTSDEPQDIARAYQEHASSYVVKPSNFAEYRDLILLIDSYWRGTVQLPKIEDLVLPSANDGDQTFLR